MNTVLKTYIAVTNVSANKNNNLINFKFQATNQSSYFAKDTSCLSLNLRLYYMNY